MNVRAVSVIISTVLIFATLAYISSVTLANSMTFEQSVYAADNCDATSTCTNNQLEPVIVRKIIALIHLPVRMKQLVTEILRATDCDSVRTQGQVGCINIAEGDRNIQSTACNSVGESVGLLQLATTIPRQVVANQLKLPASILQMATNTQNLLCARMNHCINLAQSSNTQSTVCANGGSCSNDRHKNLTSLRM